MFSKKAATLLVTIITSISSLDGAQAQENRIETVVAFARSQEAASKKQILAQPELRQELGITDAGGAGAEFKYELAFQETFFRDDVTTGMTGMSELIGQGSAVVIPFCKDRTCIVATYDEDEETGKLGLVSYGSSVRSSRIAASYARLAKLRPGYKGDAQIVDYPAGMVSFLMIDGQGPNGEATKEFLHATDDQAERFSQGEGVLAQTVVLEDMAEFIVKVDSEARQNAVQFGSLEESQDESKAPGEDSEGSAVSDKSTKHIAASSEPADEERFLDSETSLEGNVPSEPEKIETTTFATTAKTNNYIYLPAALLILGLVIALSRRRLSKAF